MKSLYDKGILVEVSNRIEKLNPDTKALWGQMNVSQMMEHCARALDYATGKTKEPRMFIGLILGPLFKSMYYNDTLWGKNTRTAEVFKVIGTPDFEKTKLRLTLLVHTFSKGGPENATTHPSPFFGKLTPEQHGLGQYKHIDHHLRQFGV